MNSERRRQDQHVQRRHVLARPRAGRSPRARGCKWRAEAAEAPQIMASASPWWTISARDQRSGWSAPGCARVGAVTPLALHQLVVGAPVVAVARVALRDRPARQSMPGLKRRPSRSSAARDHLRPADQDRPRQPLVDHDLHGAQHALVLAFGRRPRASGSRAAASNTGFIIRPELEDELAAAARGRRRSRRSAASPRRDSIAALATAGAISTIRRGSNGLRDQVVGAEAAGVSPP